MIEANIVASFAVQLDDGNAEQVGDGLFVVTQEDGATRRSQSVVLSRADLEAMLALA